MEEGIVDRDGLLVIHEPLTDTDLKAAKKEVERFEADSERFVVPSGGADFNHVHPSTLLATRSPLVEFYESPAMVDLVSRAVGRKVYALPVESDARKFSNNCKINYYRAGVSEPLNWHYDRSNQYKGDTITCILTTHLEREEDGAPIEATPEAGWPTLAYVDNHGNEREVSLQQNTMTIHVCKDTFHKVLALPPGFRRRIFVMKYSTDPTPSGVPSKLEWLTLGAQVALGHARLRKNWPYVLVALLLVFGSIAWLLYRWLS